MRGGLEREKLLRRAGRLFALVSKYRPAGAGQISPLRVGDLPCLAEVGFVDQQEENGREPISVATRCWMLRATSSVLLRVPSTTQEIAGSIANLVQFSRARPSLFARHVPKHESEILTVDGEYLFVDLDSDGGVVFVREHACGTKPRDEARFADSV